MSTFQLSHIDTPQDGLACFDVMRELRPHLSSASAFAEQVRRQAEQGYRLLAVWDGAQVAALAGYRLQENLLYGRFLYVDDLIAAANVRRCGLGGMLIDALRAEARRQACGVMRGAASVIYFYRRIVMTTLRLPYSTLSPDAYQGLIATKKALAASSLGLPLIELVNLRISQINGCAYCLEMHAKQLRAGGMPAAKLDGLAGWRVSSHFTERERAALAWAESLAEVATTHAPDDVFTPLKAHFSDAEISDLCFVIALMSAFNRLAIGMRQ